MVGEQRMVIVFYKRLRSRPRSCVQVSSASGRAIASPIPAKWCALGLRRSAGTSDDWNAQVLRAGGQGLRPRGQGCARGTSQGVPRGRGALGDEGSGSMCACALTAATGPLLRSKTPRRPPSLWAGGQRSCACNRPAISGPFKKCPFPKGKVFWCGRGGGSVGWGLPGPSSRPRDPLQNPFRVLQTSGGTHTTLARHTSPHLVSRVSSFFDWPGVAQVSMALALQY